MVAGFKFRESLGGSQAPPSFWEVPDFPGSSPNFPGSFSATSPEVLSLWNFTAIQGFPEVSQTSPEVPWTSPEVSRTCPEVSPFSGKPDTLS